MFDQHQLTFALIFSSFHSGHVNPTAEVSAAGIFGFPHNLISAGSLGFIQQSGAVEIVDLEAYLIRGKIPPQKLLDFYQGFSNLPLMRYLKASSIEYLLWLYILGCLAWLGFRLDLLPALPAWLVLAPPLAVGLGFGAVNGSLGRRVVFPAKNGETSFWKWEIGIVVLISFVVGWVIVEVKPIAFLTQAGNAQNIVKGIFNPNLSEMVPMLAALMETIYLALLATIFAIPFAFAFSYFAAKNLMQGSLLGRIAYVVIRSISTVFRSIEAIVWAIIFSVWVGIGPFAGMLALWVHSVAALIKLYSEQLENIDPGPVEAIRATGASTLQVWRYAVTPQILAPYLAFTIYRWDINVRMATIVGFVGGGGIGLALNQQQQMLAWRNVGLIMWLIAVVVWVMDIFSGYIREKLVSQ